MLNMYGMPMGEFQRYKLIMQPDEADVRARLAKKGDDPDLWYELGMALANQNRNEEAVEAFSAGIRFAPFDPYLHFARGRKLAASGKLWPAIAELTLANCIDKSDWTFMYYRATTFNLFGYYEESCRDFKACLDMVPAEETYPMIHWLYTTYLLELKDPARARAAIDLVKYTEDYPQMDYGYHRCYQLYAGLVDKEHFIDIDEMKEKCLKRPGRIELELNTMYYALFAYCVETGDEQGADNALRALLKIPVEGAFGYKKGLQFAKERGII